MGDQGRRNYGNQSDHEDGVHQHDSDDSEHSSSPQDAPDTEDKATENPAGDDDAHNFFESARTSHEMERGAKAVFCQCEDPDVVEEKVPFRPSRASNAAAPEALQLAAEGSNVRKE